MLPCTRVPSATLALKSLRVQRGSHASQQPQTGHGCLSPLLAECTRAQPQTRMPFCRMLCKQNKEHMS